MNKVKSLKLSFFVRSLSIYSVLLEDNQSGNCTLMMT